MKNRIKKSMALLLAVIMLVVGLPMSSSAAYENTYTNTGNQRSDIVGVAKTQVGNTNGLKYRSDGNSWCAAFVVWCARQAGIGSNTIKNTGWATADDLGVTYKGRNADRTTGINYTPQSGDLIIFDWKSNGYCYKSPASNYGDHVGIVDYVSNGYVYTIEGNSKNSSGVYAVRKKSYSLNDSEIKGYGIPNYSGSISHTVNSNYGKNFTSYPKAKITAGNIYDANHNQISSTAWIGTSDKCTIHEVYTDGCCKLSYPLDSGGTKTVYSKISLFNTHTHSYIENYEAAHPHKKYMKCSCGEWYYTGTTTYLSSCTACNPTKVVFDKSNILLGLSKNKTAQVTATISGNYSHWLCEWDGNIIGVDKEHSGSKITMNITSRKAGTSRLSLKAQDQNYKTIVEASIDVCVNYDYDNTFSFSYSSIYGTGDSLPFSVKYGETFTVFNNSFKREGYHFGGWNAKRNSDNTWYVAGVGWCSEETIKNNKYEKKNYTNSQELVLDESWVNGLNDETSYTFYATWLQNEFNMRFDANSGTGAMDKVSTEFDLDYTFPTSRFKNENYIFNGWNVYRVNDGTWATKGYGWLTSDELKSKNINKQVFAAGDTYKLDDSWKNGCSDEYIEYIAYAIWSPCGHSFSVKNVMESSCSKEGLKVYECVLCGAQKNEIIAVKSHTYNSGKITTAATCKSTGVKTYTCTVCKATKTKTIAKNPANHVGGTSVKNAKAATCTAKGYTGDTYCLGCGVVTAKGKDIAVKAHAYNSGKITTAATCKATGVKTYTCTVCKATKTETIAKNPSNHVGGTKVKNATAATCTAKGYTGDTYCLGCGVVTVKGKDIAVKAHSYNSGKITTAATCKSTGVKTYTCTVCKATKTETIAKNPSNHVGGTAVKNAKNAICTAKGYTGDTYCLGCGVVTVKGTEIPALGHTDSNSDGKCDRCGITLGEPEKPNTPDTPTSNCTHLCHKGGFIWRIVRFFWKLFKMNRNCSCGVAHY